MLRRLALATAIALGSVVAAPAFAQATPEATAPAAQQTPEQIVQSIADQLATAIDGHRDELKQHKEKLIGIIDEVFLPHFDIDYASILVLGQHAREATPAQRERFDRSLVAETLDEHDCAQTRIHVRIITTDGDAA